MYAKHIRAKHRHLEHWMMWFILFEVVVGGLSGIVAAAILLEWWSPGNPISDTVYRVCRAIIFPV